MIRTGSPLLRVVARMRRRMYRRFLDAMAPLSGDSILDVGATAEATFDAANYLEAWYPYKERIVAAGIDDARHLESRYPGVRFVQCSGLALPFPDASFDVVHSSAVLEHVGDRARQLQFLRELLRVCRRGFFLTTPNRWFPIEMHTLLPFAHWLPRPQFESVCRLSGRSAFASEDVLNLLGPDDLDGLASRLGAGRVTIDSVRLAGWPSNLLLSAWR